MSKRPYLDDVAMKALILKRIKTKHDIRRAEMDDAPAYESFMTAMFTENLATLIPRATEPSLEDVSRWLIKHVQSDASVLFLAEQSGLLIGTINLTQFSRPQSDHAVGMGLNIRLGYRDLGIGKALVTKAVDWFNRTQSIERIELEVTANNAAAIHLYESFGFVREGTKRYAVKKGPSYLDVHVMALLK